MSDQMIQLKANIHNKHEQYIESVLEALCLTIRQVLGVPPSEKLRDKLYEAIRFEV